MKKNFLRTFLVIWGFLMMQTTVFAIEHVHRGWEYYMWIRSEGKWFDASSNLTFGPTKLCISAWDFEVALPLENGIDFNVRCSINEDENSVTLVSAVPHYVFIDFLNEDGRYLPKGGFGNYPGQHAQSMPTPGYRCFSSAKTIIDEGGNTIPDPANEIYPDFYHLNYIDITEPIETLTIPSTVTNPEDGKTYTVTGLGAFFIKGDTQFRLNGTSNNLTMVKNLVVPASIKHLEPASLGFKHIESLDLSGCTEMETFSGLVLCEALKNIKLPVSIKEIGDMAFWRAGIEQFDFASLPNLERIGKWGFFRSQIKEVNLLSNKKLTSIDINAFSECPNIEKVYLPESLTTTCGRLFRDDPSLKEVYITSKIIDGYYGNNFGLTNNNAAIYVPLKYMDYYRTEHSETFGPDENGFFDEASDIAKLYPILESGKQYRTFSYDKPVNLDAIEGLYNPSNTLKANIVTAIDVQNRRVTFTEKTGDVAPLEGIIIEGTGEAGEFYPIKKYTGTTEPAALGDTENYLEGNGAETLSFEDKKPAGGKQRYFIMKGGDFYYCTGGTLAKWKCYLDVREPISVYGSSVSQDAKFFSIFSEDDAMPTTIKGVSDVNTDGDAYYTLDGIHVSGQPLKKGIYVHNGRKVVVR